MRTTIELTDESHAAVAALARRRGARGLSEVVQEALDTYLAALDARQTEVALELEGTVSEASATAMSEAMQTTRTSWR